MKKLLQSTSELGKVLQQYRKAFYRLGAFSAVINLLMLLPSVYMIQVYDRVLHSRNETTLLMLTLITVALFMLMAGLELVRSQTLIRVGNHLDMSLNHRVFTAAFEQNLRKSSGNAAQSIHDLTTLRQFLTGNGLFAFFDAPWAPIYLVVCFLFHWQLGVFVLVGMLILVFMTYLTEKFTKEPLAEANRAAIAAGNYANNNLRNAEVIESMGMLPALRDRWFRFQGRLLEKQTEASDKAARINALTKFIRISMQSTVLGLGALLVLDNQMSGGMMIATSILMGRALQPVELAIGSWKQLISARAAYQRLEELLETYPARGSHMSLPRPEGQIGVENVIAVPPGAPAAVLKGLTFAINPGEVVGVVGPSASGKSTLARVLVGIWPTQAGKVRLDGADVFLWNKDELGPHIGYLPQDIELFQGSIAENIARFGEIDSDKVIDAAKRAGVHDMILRLPQGYETMLGEGGGSLSGGQKQRIGLARAMYGSPSIIVLDEPNSNLDDVGEQALVRAIAGLKAAGTTVILITHRTSIINSVDKLLVLRDGTISFFGPRDQVLQALAQAAQQSQVQQLKQ
ncbi:type I secretion system permease/ATPase [Vogesella fluminis]|uniref:Alkaline protease secretion ATP-binding protein AprD n=1 Tax=Vogesella fluminis TaxID=1069161 RepID=A0ABQ3HGN1_9NEIS|nr:type I secretion system permease/ATPase [Vogesella fluminis]GHD81132.1 alkaline protease secretion ATP-binding protein AprD [Vogesella fluminis]